jgi:ornithine cyclodeaminase/alanine dehydrogenase-like protein (mu-crystallin family)
MSEVLYLSSLDVRKLLPSLLEQLGLVERTLEAMRDPGLQLPPKPAIYPRDHGFIHAMPAYLPGLDIAAVKWIGGSSTNKAQGSPYLSGLIVLNDPETMAPRAIMDAAEITAARTAAITGVCVTRFAPPEWRTVGIVGYGVQGRAHARLMRALNPDARIVVTARNGIDADSDVDGVADAREAADAEIVITSIPMGRPAAPFLLPEWLGRSRLVLPVDFDAALDPAVVAAADAFLVDDVATFEHYRQEGYFRGWPNPHGSLVSPNGSALSGARIVCCNLGMATLDAVFAQDVLERALAAGLGTPLPS